MYKYPPIVTGRAARWRCHMWSSERPVGLNSTTTRKKRAEKAGLLEAAGGETHTVIFFNERCKQLLLNTGMKTRKNRFYPCEESREFHVCSPLSQCQESDVPQKHAGAVSPSPAAENSSRYCQTTSDVDSEHHFLSAH